MLWKMQVSLSQQYKECMVRTVARLSTELYGNSDRQDVFSVDSGDYHNSTVPSITAAVAKVL